MAAIKLVAEYKPERHTCLGWSVTHASTVRTYLWHDDMPRDITHHSIPQIPKAGLFPCRP